MIGRKAKSRTKINYNLSAAKNSVLTAKAYFVTAT